ncbi:MAG: alpha/beta fold hydrolase [Parvularculaceae bacterium]|nr:alpha/beta fold hydrolase [Parvularculaceae bacterium]
MAVRRSPARRTSFDPDSDRDCNSSFDALRAVSCVPAQNALGMVASARPLAAPTMEPSSLLPLLKRSPYQTRRQDGRQMRTRIRRIAANGLNHFVRDSGPESGPAAVLLHGFPDSGAVWSKASPLLAEAGFRLIAPDLRGFGETDMAPRVEDYDIHAGAAKDILGILDHLNIARAHLVGHDFGAPVAWALAALHPGRFISLAALSVGHTRAFLAAGAEQKWRSLYIVLHQFRGLCEWAYRFNNWALLRRHWSLHGEIEEAIRQLARPGRLTAGLNWYRCNASLARMVNPPRPGAFGEERVKIPTLGVWSSEEPYLTEAQMTGSAAYVDAPWRYERIEGAGHWIPYDAPERLAALLIGHWRAAAAG